MTGALLALVGLAGPLAHAEPSGSCTGPGGVAGVAQVEVNTFPPFPPGPAYAKVCPPGVGAAHAGAGLANGDAGVDGDGNNPGPTSGYYGADESGGLSVPFCGRVPCGLPSVDIEAGVYYCASGDLVGYPNNASRVDVRDATVDHTSNPDCEPPPP
jgi:hypothetical protein